MDNYLVQAGRDLGADRLLQPVRRADGAYEFLVDTTKVSYDTLVYYPNTDEFAAWKFGASMPEWVVPASPTAAERQQYVLLGREALVALKEVPRQE